MPHETVFVTLHVHTDGPIPGPHSLLTLSSAAHRGDGGLITTFTTNLRELPGATLHPASLEQWRTRADDWLSTRRAARPPALATSAYVQWVEKLPERPTLVTDPVGTDHLFVYWFTISVPTWLDPLWTGKTRIRSSRRCSVVPVVSQA